MDIEDRSALAMLAVKHTISFTNDELNNENLIQNSINDQINKTTSSSCNSFKKEFDNSSLLSQDDEDNFDKINNNICWSYIESYAKAIQAVEWMLKLEKLRQESAMFSTLSM